MEINNPTGNEKKIFIIAGREFEFKDLTIDESEEVNKITSKARISEKEFSADYTSEETKRFLSIVLKPLDGKPVDEKFFGKTLNKDFIEIFMAFFFGNLTSMMGIAIKYTQSTKRSIAQSAISNL